MANASTEAERASTAASQSKPLEPKNVEEGSTIKKHEKNVAAAYISIILAAVVPCLVIFLVSGLLIGLTFAKRVDINPGHPELRISSTPSTGQGSSTLFGKASNLESSGGSDAYYIQFNPSSLSTIASWTGKIIPYLSSAMMGLAAYFAADYLRQLPGTAQKDKLLTPEQMALLLGLLSGGVEQLWDTVRFRAKKGQSLKRPIPLVVTALVFTTFLSLVIQAVDSWFGIVVTPVEQTLLQIKDPPGYSFGRGLSIPNSPYQSNCTDSAKQTYDGEWYFPCNLASGEAGTILSGNDEAFRILNNVSTKNTISSFSPNSSHTFFYLNDAASSSDVDYKTTTFAVSTQCQAITTKCHVGSTTANIEDSKFRCTPSFGGFLGWSGAAFSSDDGSSNSLVGIQFFGDPGLTNNFSTTPSPYSPQNPLYFGTWATGQMGANYNDSEIVYNAGIALAYSWVLNCSATVFDVTYTWVNGSVASFVTTPSNGTVGGIISAAYAAGFAAIPLQTAATLAGFGNSSVDLEAVTASYFSQGSLAMAIGAMSNRINLLEQSRTTEILTRVPLVPFYVLIALKFLYALAAILFALSAIILAHPPESGEVKAQLSIQGLVAAAFGDDEFKNQVVGSLKNMAQRGGDDEGERKGVTIVKTEDERGVETVTELVQGVVKRN